MSLIVLAAAASFACLNPSHHDGDAIRCAGQPKSMRLHAIDAPEMPGACRPGRNCTPGDPYRSRDYLAGLTRGHRVECRQVDTDDYGRRVVDCAADGRSLGCDMVAAGMAVERYGRLGCKGAATAVSGRLADVPGAAPLAARTHLAGFGLPADAAQGPEYTWRSWPVLGLWLLLTNALSVAAFLVDKRRAQAGDAKRRIPEVLLLGLAAVGGSAGAIAAQQILRHKTRKHPFANRLLMIAGVHLGGILALSAPVL